MLNKSELNRRLEKCCNQASTDNLYVMTIKYVIHQGCGYLNKRSYLTTFLRRSIEIWGRPQTSCSKR